MRDVMQRHARSIWLSVFLITLAGLVAAIRLPVSLFPHVDYPRVVVSIDAGERDPEQMAAIITRPAEIALRAIPGVTTIRSTTSRGSAEIALGFNWGDDMAAATTATQGALATILPDLPVGTRFNVRRSDPTIFPVLGISLTSDKRDGVALAQLAQLRLRPALSAVTGVAGVDIVGGAAPEIEVEIDPARIRTLGLTMTDVTTAIGSANTVAAVGRIEDRHRLYLALVEDRLSNEADVARIPIKAGATPGAGVATLGEIATIRRAPAPVWKKVSADGQSAVLINIRQTPNADAVALVEHVLARLKDVALPADVKVSTFYDQSELVGGAAGAVRDAILLGALLAAVVLFLFLRSWRLMVITAVLLPAVLAATCLALYALHMSLNMMTLGGMAAAVGLVVDDAVVMLEHLMRRLQEAEGRDQRPSMLCAAREMARPLLGSTMATIVVFVPLAFVSGVSGGFFKALAVTMVAALAVSLVYARYVLPLVADRWLTLNDAKAADKAHRYTGPMIEGYGRLAGVVFARPVRVLLFGAVILVVCGSLAWTHLQSGFMPKMDEGGFILDYKAKPGAALSDTDRLLRQVETIVRQTPEVLSYSRRTGVQLGGGLSEADEGDFFIRLKGGSRRDIDEVMAEIRGKIQATVPGLEIETAQLMEDLIGDLTAVPQPIEVKLFSDDPQVLTDSAAKVLSAMTKIDGIGEVASGLRVAGDAIIIKVDRSAAEQAGVDPDLVAKQVDNQLGGSVATQILAGEQLIDIRVRLPQDLRQDTSALGKMTIRSPDGHLMALSSIASIGVAAGQRQITREDLAPFIPITARLEGKDLGSAVQAVKAAVSGLKLPPSVRVDYGGLYAQQQQSFADLTTVFIAALLLSALLLTVLFERWALTIAVLATVLLSVAAVFSGLWLTGTELDISALMGLTMVVGMITELAIFYLAELNMDDPIGASNLVIAGKARLRPIVMSALIAILTLAPLALGMGRGSGLQRPLATAIIFGLVVGAPLVVTALPMLILLLSRKATDVMDRASAGT